MNIVCLSGNVCSDIELRKTQSGTDVANFSIAINESKDHTEYVRCVAWSKTAELIGQYVQKGNRLSCSGRLQTRTWDDQQGNKRYATEVIVDRFDFPPKGNSDMSAHEPSPTYGSDDVDSSEIPFAQHMNFIGG